MKFVTWGLVILFLASGAATGGDPGSRQAQDQGDSRGCRTPCAGTEEVASRLNKGVDER